jgi:hypothetical protein
MAKSRIPSDSFGFGEACKPDRVYDRWDNPTVMKAFILMAQINRWLASCYAAEYCPHAHISVASFGLAVLINDVCIWDSENNDDCELTLDYAKSRYKEYATHLFIPFE